MCTSVMDPQQVEMEVIIQRLQLEVLLGQRVQPTVGHPQTAQGRGPDHPPVITLDLQKGPSQLLQSDLQHLTGQGVQEVDLAVLQGVDLDPQQEVDLVHQQ